MRAATAVRQGTTRLARRLRIERPEPGQTALELGILAHLHRRGPTTPGALATAERVQPQSLTRTLASLERQRLAVRTLHRHGGGLVEVRAGDDQAGMQLHVRSARKSFAFVVMTVRSFS